MKRLLLILNLLFITSIVFGQENSDSSFRPKVFFGPGLGLDYGGIGVRGEIQPHKNIGIFIGGGYNLAEPAFNAGASFKLLTTGRVQPVVMAMYGYNAAVRINYWNGGAYTEDYYGPSVGAGCELYNKNKKNTLALEILVPFRNKKFHQDHPGDDGSSQFLPVTFTIGYNFCISKEKKTKTD